MSRKRLLVGLFASAIILAHLIGSWMLVMGEGPRLFAFRLYIADAVGMVLFLLFVYGVAWRRRDFHWYLES